VSAGFNKVVRRSSELREDEVSNYDPLRDYLAALAEDLREHTMSFGEIEELVGQLPRSARSRQAWWASTDDARVEARAWWAAGWYVLSADQTAERVVFARRVESGPAAVRNAVGSSLREPGSTSEEGKEPKSRPEAPRAEPGEAEPAFLKELARSRLVRLPRHHRALRRVVRVAGAAVLAAAVIMAVGSHFPSTSVIVRASLVGPQMATVSVGALVLGIICTAAAWILVIAGLFLANWKVRAPGLVLIVAGALAERYVLPRLSPFNTTIGVVSLSGVLLLGLLTIGADLWSQRRTSKIDLATPAWTRAIVIAVAVLVCAVFGGQAIDLASKGSLGRLALSSFSGLELLYVTVILIIPMLLLAGADMADMASEISRGISRSLERRQPRSSLVLPMITGGVAALAVAVTAHSLGADIFRAVLIAALPVALIFVIVSIARPYPAWDKSLLALAAAAAAFVFLVAVQVATGIQRVPPPSGLLISPLDKAFVYSGAPNFSIRYPSLCGSFSKSAQAEVKFFEFTGCTPIQGSYSFSFLIATFSRDQYPNVSGPCRILDFLAGQVQSCVREPNVGPWQTVESTGNGDRRIVWTRRIGSENWMLMGQTIDQATTYNFLEPVLSAMRQSWRPETAPAPAVNYRAVQRTGQVPVASSGFLARTRWVLIALAAGGALVLVGGRRRSDRLNRALIYVVTAGAWVGLISLEGSSGTATGSGHLLPGSAIGGVQALSGIAALLFVAAATLGRRADANDSAGCSTGGDRAIHRKIRHWLAVHVGIATEPVVRRRLGSLLALNVSMLLVWGAAILYGTAAHLGDTLAILQGLIVLLALTWDFFSSGEMLNHGKAKSIMPRRARILVYLGYLLLTLSVVLELGTLREPASGMPLDVISTEMMVEVGIVGLGVPLVISIFLVRWFQHDHPAADNADQPNRKQSRPLAADRPSAEPPAM
jgi:hypothetical protein